MKRAALGLLAVAPGALAAATWGDDETLLCRVIAGYDARPGVPSLFEQFEHAAFEASRCADPDGCDVRAPMRFEASVEIASLLATSVEG